MALQLKDLVRVFVKGGIISPGDFLKVLLVAEKLGAEHIHFGSRQDILFSAKEKSKNILDETFQSIHTEYEINTFHFQNVVSSFVAQDILPSRSWLASHVYHYVLESFNYRTRLKINVVDSSQSLVPLFTGQINFIASGKEHYWYVYLRFQELQEKPWQMPMLVYSDDLVKIARALETLTEFTSYPAIYSFLTENVKMNTLPVTEDLVLPETQFPYYEGINRLPDGKYWLGLYWRTNKYRIDILKGIMERCIETEIGKVSLTPWKSFIIKGIFEKDRVGWEKLMGRFGMNLRHSSLELNWHLPVLDQEALELKNFLVRELDSQDISTYGLTFTIKTKAPIILFTSVVIEQHTNGTEDSYNILYSKNFNPNLDYQYYAKDVPKSVLATLIQELSIIYYENLAESQTISDKVRNITRAIQKDLYQCIHCQTIYDSEYGDPAAGIPKGTSFSLLPKDYLCPTCGGSLDSFKKVMV